MTTTITELATNPPVVITTGGTAIAANLTAGLPIYINVAVLIYVVAMASHKIYQFYKEVKKDKSESG